MNRAYALVALLLLGCPADDPDPADIDARPTPDATVIFDAPLQLDAMLSEPDAAAPSPDAAPMNPDARPPDAAPPIDAPPPPDAPLPVDAATPDAPLPDAPLPPDAAPDAAAPDADTGGMCLPQCYIDVTAPLVVACIPSGACTSNFNIQTFTTTLCFENGVKIVGQINGQNLVTTVKKPGGDTCYILDITATSQNSATTMWKSPTGTPLVAIDIDDVMMGNIQKYRCNGGTAAPITVDLNSPECLAQRPDAGAGQPGGQSCTQSAACQP